MKKTLALILVLVMMLSLSVTAMAAAPSAEATGSPELVPTKDASGAEVAGLIVDKDGKEVAGLTADDITVTPVAKSSDATVKEAYNAIKDAKSLTGLIDNLEEVLAGVNKDVKGDDLAVLDMFGVTLSEAAKAKLTDGCKFSMNFKTDLKPGDTLVVTQYVDGKWVALEATDYVINADGTVTVTLGTAAPIAFLAKSAA